MPPTNGTEPFHSLLEQLRQRVIERIAQGDVTERGLARKAGVSQPHLHNVLKGIRTMTPEVADRLMEALKWNMGDL
jgi:plasmid maintenance system antidote protein VapI